jgi:hypothetical protein
VYSSGVVSADNQGGVASLAEFFIVSKPVSVPFCDLDCPTASFVCQQRPEMAAHRHGEQPGFSLGEPAAVA